MLRGVPPGEYLLVLLPASRADALRDTAAFEPLLQHAVTVVLAEGQRTVQDLTADQAWSRTDRSRHQNRRTPR